MRTNSHRIHRLHELPFELISAFLSPAPRDSAGVKGTVAQNTLGEIDWQSVAEDANSHAVGVLVYQRLVELGLTRFLPTTVCRAWEADLLHAKLQHIIQRQDALAISQTFSRSGLRHAFIKGFAYRDWLYHPAWVRLGGDVDILIDRRNVESARQFVRNHGFIQAAYSADHQHFRPARSDEIARVESAHYELAEFTKDHVLTNPPAWLLGSAFVRRSPFAYGTTGNRHVLHSSFDIHWAIHFMFASASPLNHLMTVSLPIDNGLTIPVLSLEWNIVISAFKLYLEAIDRPRYGFNHLVDLIALLGLAPQVDWCFLQDIVRKHRLEAAMFYTLSAAQMLSGKIEVPDSVLYEWSQMDSATPSSAIGQQLDYGDFIPYLVNRRIPIDFKWLDA